MAIFNQSTLAGSAACLQIADSAGASADAVMVTRALTSLKAAQAYFNGRAKWDYLRTEAPLVAIIAGTAVTGVTASAGQASALAPAGHGLQVGDILFGSSAFYVGTRVTSTASGGFGFGSTIQSSGTQSFTVSAMRDSYDLPSDWKSTYSVRLYGTQSTLRPIRRREYDRGVVNEFVATTPLWYDDYTNLNIGKIRVLPPPNINDVMQIKYYRRGTITSATADTTALDIPQDYEPYLIAWAKWHFLSDKGEPRNAQGQTWLAFATDGIRTMLADQTALPDEDLMFTPGHYSYNPAYGPNSVRPYFDEAW